MGGKAWGALLLVAVVGVGLRVLFGVVGVEPRPGVFGGAPRELSHDALLFEEYADHLRHGEGYSSGDPPRPEASHPPVFPIALAALSTVGLDTFDSHRVALAVLGGIGVVLVGLVGRRLAGPAVGLIAACIAALHPLWVQPAGVIMSESLYLIIVPGVLLLALYALSAPSIGRFIALGALIGVATLTRSEALLLVVFVGAPTVILARVRRVVYGVVLIAGTLAIVGPWVVRNAIQLDGPTLSTNAGATLSGSYCDDVFSGRRFGGWEVTCAIGLDEVLHGQRGEPVAADRALVRYAADYAHDRLGKLPLVATARVGRLWGVYQSGDQLAFDVAEGREQGWQEAGQYFHWLLLPCAIAGIAVVNDRKWLLILGPIVLATINAAVFYGSTRIRVVAEPSLALFAAFGIVTLAGKIRDRVAHTPRRPALTCGAFD
jgi:4-amino-4-deoxy-L-arabinose transferase-like glycosyltransferase